MIEELNLPAAAQPYATSVNTDIAPEDGMYGVIAIIISRAERPH
jgi:hypothetical protein